MLEKVLADDFVNLSPSGPAPGKGELLKTWQAHAGQAPPYSVERSDMLTFILGDAAVTAYTKTYTAKENGNLVHEDTTHVYTRTQGGWKLRFSRSSLH